MLKISKDEAMMLQKKGFRFGEAIFATHSRWHHYFLVEGSKAHKVLNNYRKSITN